MTRILVGARRGLPSSELPVVVLQGDPAGPVAAVTANLHGDECTGIGVVHRLDAWLAAHPPVGTVVLYPSCNPGGLAAQSRLVPVEEADLNRLFPGDARGTLAERVAAALWADLGVRRPDVVIDLHADAPWAIPYVIVDRPVRRAGTARRDLADRILALADGTGLTVLREYPDETYVQYALDRSLAGAVVNVMGVPAVTLEVGPRRYLDAAAVDVALEATLGVLGVAGVIAPYAAPTRTRVGGVWRRASSPRAKQAGVLRPALRPGDRFERGDRLAWIVALTGEELEDVRAAGEGVVVSWVETCWVPAGGVLGTLGVSDRERL